MTHSPSSWQQSEERDQFFRKVATNRSFLMLDYDGTLAPFAPDRLRALPYPGVVPFLEQLATLQSVRLVLVTGRPAVELQKLLSVKIPLEIWGSHGREQITAGGQYRLHPLAPGEQQVLENVTATLQSEGYGETLERKPASLAVHWRTMEPDARTVLEQTIRTLCERQAASAGLHLLPFDGGLEIRSEAVNKGDAVLSILREREREATPGPVAYLGDDTTDEDAFRALHGHGLSILVRQDWRKSDADYWIRPPAELITFLQDWVTAARSKEA